MDMRPDPPNRPTRRLPLLAVILSAVLVVVVVVAGALYLTGHLFPQPTQVPTATGAATPTSQPTQGNGSSPLLFGTNMSLFDAHDQMLTSATARSLMQQMHIRIVRMPTRSKLPQSVEIQAAQAIKSIGAIPLIALQGMQHPDTALTRDMQMVNDMNGVFGTGVVYYEFGNEDDYNGIPMARYISGWNTVIPQLKKIARNARFVGPVSYQYNRNNLTTFLQGAQPRPDAVSWHEYTCSYKNPSDQCLTRIDLWTTHIADARDAMQHVLGSALPIMITEWNYAYDQTIQHNGLPFDDAKYDDATFITNWTSKALHTLANSHIFASMQYSVTNTALPLIANDNTITTMGATFQTLYEQIITGS